MTDTLYLSFSIFIFIGIMCAGIEPAYTDHKSYWVLIVMMTLQTRRLFFII